MIPLQIKIWKELFLESLSLLPEDITISLSGGIDSSSIVFGLAELGRTPKHAVTFKLDGYKESSDIYYTKKICDEYGIDLKIANIPNLSKDELLLDLKDVVEDINKIRNIDILCCYAYKYMIPLMTNNNLVTGMYPGTSSISFDSQVEKEMRLAFKTNDFEVLNKKIIADRENYFNGLNINGQISNYEIIKQYCFLHNINMLFPFKYDKLYHFSGCMSLFDFYYLDNKFYSKAHLRHWIFKEQFDKIGNSKNAKDMHVNNHLKEYFTKVLTDDNYHAIVSICNQVKKDNKANDLGEFF
jgi:hypothetical protein